MKTFYKALIPLGLIVLFFIVSIIYTKIQDEVGIHSNDQIIDEIEGIISDKTNDISRLTSFLINADTYSRDFKINNHLKQGITFYSNTDWENSGISFEEYKRRYYNTISHETSPCYVPDFEIPKSMFQNIMDRYNFRTAHLKYECSQKTVSFDFKYRHFYPTDRTIILQYYPNEICVTAALGQNRNPEGYYWTYKVNDNWIIKSNKE